MTHLSEQELIEYSDRRMTAAAERIANAHCALCPQCRQKTELHRALRRSGAEPMSGLLSNGFTDSILRRAHVPRPAPRFSWILQNSSNILAMVLVLGILSGVGYIAAQLPQTNGGDESAYSKIFSMWTDASSSAMAVLSVHAKQAVTPVVSKTGSVFGNVFWLAAAAFLLLGFLDTLRVKRKISSTR